MANSKLATYTHITANHSGQRQNKVTKITPHYMAAYWTGKQCADYFAGTGRQASSNYCVGVNGDIAVSVPENCRAWTTSSAWNDNQAITIECGNNADSSLPDACYKSLVKLCADICQRYGINPHYDGTVYGTITMHKQFASTSCPGSWLANKITSGQFERDVKAAMSGTVSAGSTALYRVRKGFDDAKSQIGAYREKANAIKSCPKGYGVYLDGRTIYQNRADGKWDREAVVKKGDTVKSLYCATVGKEKDGLIEVPRLGGLVPVKDLAKAGDKVYLKTCKIEAIVGDLVQVHGYKVFPDTLMKKVG